MLEIFSRIYGNDKSRSSANEGGADPYGLQIMCPRKAWAVFGIGLIPFGFALQSVQYWFGERKGSRMTDNGPILVDSKFPSDRR